MAAVVTHPLDLGTDMASRYSFHITNDIAVKVRLQTRAPNAPKTMVGTFINILRNQGIFGLYNGLTAALLRQLTYSTVRFGVYEDLKTRFAPVPTPTNPKPKQSFSNLVLMSSAAGFLGGLAGNPGDVLNVRMQSDAALPPEKQRHYNNAINGLVRMIREEGFASIFRGVWPNAARALLMTSSQLASYDTFKHICLEKLAMPDNLVTHFTSSLAAGFVATTVCSPVDVIKTRIMSAGRKVGILEALQKAARKEGLFWIFRGWVPSFVRLGPQTIVTMVFFEQHKKIYRKWKDVE
jgi:solute carrier family 25 (mitochondrial dicarboxylate transporter), member 10